MVLQPAAFTRVRNPIARVQFDALYGTDKLGELRVGIFGLQAIVQKRFPGEDDIEPFRARNAQCFEEEVRRSSLVDVPDLFDETGEIFLRRPLVERGFDQRPEIAEDRFGRIPCLVVAADEITPPDLDAGHPQAFSQDKGIEARNASQNAQDLRVAFNFWIAHIEIEPKQIGDHILESNLIDEEGLATGLKPLAVEGDEHFGLDVLVRREQAFLVFAQIVFDIDRPVEHVVDEETRGAAGVLDRRSRGLGARILVQSFFKLDEIENSAAALCKP